MLVAAGADEFLYDRSGLAGVDRDDAQVFAEGGRLILAADEQGGHVGEGTVVRHNFEYVGTGSYAGGKVDSFGRSRVGEDPFRLQLPYPERPGRDAQ